ncbi:hypothetical protein AMJ85_02910 [candidate division BRC1 bacterium SM23_51]|nr:MAG: hypothetical protein AMJ85_02910 [candidate division BRC1 bacterium SM23_51]
MGKKKQTRGVAKSPAVSARPRPQATERNILLNWRFNLIVLSCMELLVVAFFLPREITRYRQVNGQEALLDGDWSRAYKYYRPLHQQDQNNPTYLKALGDVALGRRQYSRALDYYDRATKRSPNLRDVKVQAALALQGLAQAEKDPQRRTRYVERSVELMRLAYREEPYSLKVSYWMGAFAQAAGDSIRAAQYYARVRAEAVGRGELNAEQERLIDNAQKRLEALQTAVFSGKDYALNLAGMEIAVLPPGLTARDRPSIPPPAATSPTTSTGSVTAISPIDLRTTAAPTTVSR